MPEVTEITDALSEIESFGTEGGPHAGDNN